VCSPRPSRREAAPVHSQPLSLMSAFDTLRTLDVSETLGATIGTSVALGAIALWLVSASGPPEEIVKINPEVAAERVSACGLGPVTVRYDDLLQSTSCQLEAPLQLATANSPVSTRLRAITMWNCPRTFRRNLMRSERHDGQPLF
jgi:hypothetical protein